MCEAYTYVEVAAAVSLACIDPRLWHDITSDLVQQKLGLDQQENTDQ